MALLALVSTQKLFADSISTNNLYVSSITGLSLGTTSSELTSTIDGLGSLGYISSSQLVSTVAGIGTGGGGGLASIPSTLSTFAVLTSSVRTSTLLTNTLSIGDLSTITSLQFYGLQGNYNNTVLAEISTGAGTQELLVFKGSSTSDRLRFQTTGNFVVETGVSARLWSNTTIPTQSNVTPAFIINSSSNVGIQTATPGTTLDVAGTGRFQLASTLSINVSTMNKGFPLVSAVAEASMAIVTAAGPTYFSYDGTTWLRGTGNGSQPHGLAFNGFYWISGTESGVYRSGDGINWSATSFTGTPTSAVAWNGNLWVVGGWYGGMWFSYDGYTWTACPQAPPQAVQDIVWGNDKFIATCAGAVYYSYDGLYWFSLGNILAGSDQTYCVAYNGLMWLIGGRYASTACIAYSYDGIRWINTTVTYNVVDIVWSGSRWAAITTTNQTVLTSPDGITWTARTNPFILNLGSAYITWNGTYFYIVSDDAFYISRSTDGITWFLVSSNLGSQPRKIKARIPLPIAATKQPAGIYAQNLFLGISTNQSLVRFPGPDGLYRNTAFGEISSTQTRFAQELIMFKGSTINDRIRLQTTGEIRFEAGVPSRFFSSISSIAPITTPTFLISTNSNVGIGTALPAATLDVVGTGRFQILSSLALNVSTINGAVPGSGGSGDVTSANLVSTTSQLQSNITNWSQYPTTSDIILSNTTGITLQDPNNTLQLKSEYVSITGVQGGFGSLGLASASFLTSSSLESYSIGFSDLVTGTVSSFFVGRGDGVTLTAAPIYISSVYFGDLGGTVVGQLTTDETATDLFWNGSKLNKQSGGGGGGAIDYVSAFTISSGSINTSSITGSQLQFIGMQGESLYSISSYFGAASTATSLKYWGLLGNYNNTVLTEVSTGAGTQEFLVFKGSSASDRVRFQTTGNFVVETGVSARVWDDNTTATLSNTTPAFIIDTSSNVGIQTATPATTLDVAGTGRFTEVSTITVRTNIFYTNTFNVTVQNI